MKMKGIKNSILILVITAAASSSGCFILSCQQQKENESNRPNLVFIFPDQMRAQTLGFMKKEPVLTPHLDKFSKESMVFTNAVSNSPVLRRSGRLTPSREYPHGRNIDRFYIRVVSGHCHYALVLSLLLLPRKQPLHPCRRQ